MYLFSNTVLNSDITSIVDNGLLGKYFLTNLNQNTTLKTLQIKGTIIFDHFDEIYNLLERLSKTNISNFYCIADFSVYTSTDLYESYIEERWNKIFDNNFSITSFYFLIEFFMIEIEIFRKKMRFAKVKPIDQSI